MLSEPITDAFKDSNRAYLYSGKQMIITFLIGNLLSLRWTNGFTPVEDNNVTWTTCFLFSSRIGTNVCSRSTEFEPFGF